MFCTNFSPTKLEDYENCGVKFYMRAFTKWEEESVYSIGGKFVHKLFEGTVDRALGLSRKHPDVDKALTKEQREEAIKVEKTKPPEYCIKDFADIVQTQNKQVISDVLPRYKYSLTPEEIGHYLLLFENGLTLKYLKRPPIATEQKFFMLISKTEDEAKLISEKEYEEGRKDHLDKATGKVIPSLFNHWYIFIGVCDLVTKEKILFQGIEGEKIVILDYKTGKSKSVSQLYKNWQYKIYSLWAILKYPQYLFGEMVFAYLDEKRVSPRTLFFSKENKKKLIREIRYKCRRISTRKIFSRNKNFLCKNWCDFYGFCHLLEKAQMRHGPMYIKLLAKRLIMETTIQGDHNES